MAAEEDKKFNSVLGGFLVNDLHAHAGHLHCPGSDVLAAYHERSLLPEEMNSCKEHIVGCARCQAVLSELEATDSISLQVCEKEEPVLAAATGMVEPSSARRQAPVTSPKKSRIASISRGVRWQWLAPAGALAAGLLVWIAWHENQPPRLNSLSEIKTAKVEPLSTAPPQPSATRQGPTSPSLDRIGQDQLAGASKAQGAIGGFASAEKSPLAENLKQLKKSDARARSALAEPPRKGAGTREDVSRDSSMAADRVQNQPAQEPKAGVVGAMAETVEVQPSAANAQMQAQQTQQNQPSQRNQLNAQKLPGPLEQAQRPQKKAKTESPALAYRAETVPPPAPPTPAPTPAAGFNEVGSLQIAGAASPHLIPSPGRKTLWRADHAGMIEFSNDGGASWSRQTSNVFVDLTGGSAPSDKVCWIVGRSGIILLTTDAGSHWTTLHSPLDEDLGGVRATDALHATIWNLGNTRTFETSDGGRTWNPIANP